MTMRPHKEPDADDRGGRFDHDADDARTTGKAKAQARGAMHRYDQGMHSSGAGLPTMEQHADRMHPVKRR